MFGVSFTNADINVELHNPLKKDIDRAKGLEYSKGTWHGSGQPWHSSASSMSKLILDPLKLIRRAKAVVQVWGTRYRGNEYEVWTPFKEALKDMGFTRDQISLIEKYSHE